MDGYTLESENLYTLRFYLSLLLDCKLAVIPEEVSFFFLLSSGGVRLSLLVTSTTV
jgi:hypothetical protein